MTSDLAQLRDHARFMATRSHGPGCPPNRSTPTRAHQDGGLKWCGNDQAHEAHDWDEPSKYVAGSIWDWTCHGICGGCIPGPERALWTQIADEIEAYLQPADDGQAALL